jgi:hypothetical protein
VAFNATTPYLLAKRRIPVPIGAAMSPVLPISINGTVTLAAKQLRLIPGNLTSAVIDESVSVGGVMAVETTRVDPMFQVDFGMLSQSPLSLRRRRQDLMAVAASVGVHA